MRSDRGTSEFLPRPAGPSRIGERLRRRSDAERHARRTAPILLVAAALAGAPGSAEPQDGSPPGSPEAHRFLERARATAPRFLDRREAVSSGYRRLGPDFPGMGVHWAHPGLAVSGSLDPTEPAVLCYVTVDGDPRLVGLAYALPLAEDESPPDAPFGREVWHDHRDAVDEESLLLSHPASHGATKGGYRLAMIHVWTPLGNPEGILALNNWTLPFVRAGVPVPHAPSSESARGLSLAGDGPAYYLDLLEVAADLSGGERDAAGALLRAYGDRAEAWVARRRKAVERPTALAPLEELWRSLWRDLEEAVRPETWKRIAPLGR